jgi:hypothetical protein
VESMEHATDSFSSAPSGLLGFLFSDPGGRIGSLRRPYETGTYGAGPGGTATAKDYAARRRSYFTHPEEDS